MNYGYSDESRTNPPDQNSSRPTVAIRAGLSVQVRESFPAKEYFSILLIFVSIMLDNVN